MKELTLTPAAEAITAVNVLFAEPARGLSNSMQAGGSFRPPRFPKPTCLLAPSQLHCPEVHTILLAENPHRVAA